MSTISKRLGIWALVVGAILTIPFFTNAPWTGSDYVFGGILLFGAASLYEFATRNMADRRGKAVIGFSVAFVLAVIWVYAATGFEGIIDRL